MLDPSDLNLMLYEILLSTDLKELIRSSNQIQTQIQWLDTDSDPMARYRLRSNDQIQTQIQ